MLRWNAIEIIICWDSSPNTTFLVRQFRQLATQYPHGQPVFEHFWTSILFPAEVAAPAGAVIASDHQTAQTDKVSPYRISRQ